MLVENSEYKNMKSLVYIWKHQCNSEWLGNPIALEIEHKNGVHNDNRLEFLCPNCHAHIGVKMLKLLII